MKLYEIYYRKLEDNGSLGEKTFPFESDTESEWDDLEALAEHLFGAGDLEINGDWVIFDDIEYKFSWKD